LRPAGTSDAAISAQNVVQELRRRLHTEKTDNRERPLRAVTIRTILSVLRRVMVLAVERGDLARNPLQNLGRLLSKVERQQADQVRQIDSWTREEVSKLLDVVQQTEPLFLPGHHLPALHGLQARRGPRSEADQGELH